MIARALLLVLTLFATSAHAQLGDLFTSGKEKNLTIDKVEFGFGGLVPLERWTPMTVWLTGGPKGFSGVMIVEYAQDATQSARIVTPAAATPGVSTPVQVTVCLPGNLESVSVELVDQDGKTRARQTWSNSGTPSDAPLDYELVEDQAMVAAVRPASASSAFKVKDGVSGTRHATWYGYPGQAGARWQYRGTAIDVEALPTNWSAYAGLSAIVVPTESLRSVNAAAINAVRTWVSGGGRLVLLAPTAGDAWRRWLGDDDAAIVDLDEVSRHETPAGIAEAVRMAGVGIPRPSDESESRPYTGKPYPPGEQTNPPVPTLERPDGFDPRPAGSVPGRAVRVTAAGVAEGWSVRWPLKSSSGAEPIGLIAEGPVGLGWVTVIGVEPQTTAEVGSAAVNAAVWAEALRFAVRRVPDRTEDTTASTWAQTHSAPDGASRAALTRILDSLSTVPPIGVGVFVAILVCLALMAVLVGPVDAIALRALRLQHFSWLTAILWIIIASVGAYVAPSLLRSARTQVNRVSITDVVMDAPGSPKRRGPAWTSGVTGIFAGSRGEYPVRGVDDAAWWRGVSATTQYQRLKPRGFPPMQTVQRPGMSGGEPGNVPESLWLGQWTFRTMVDDGPAAARVGAVLTRDGDEWKVSVTNLPAGAKVEVARLVLAGSVMNVLPVVGASDGSGRWSGSASKSLLLGADVLLAGVTLNDVSKSAQGDGPGWAAAGLPGPSSRSVSIAQRVASGEWGMLALSTSGGAGELDAGPGVDSNQTRVYRVLIPLDRDQRGDPVVLSPPALPDFPRVPSVEEGASRAPGASKHLKPSTPQSPEGGRDPELKKPPPDSAADDDTEQPASDGAVPITKTERTP